MQDPNRTRPAPDAPVAGSSPCVLVTVPSYGGLDQEVVLNGVLGASQSPFPVELQLAKGSALASVFNRLWVYALNNRKYTHFAMLHSDVVPEPTWVAKLLAVMEREKADIVSTVLPIKSEHGWTSTAIGRLKDPFGFEKRFTMKEVVAFPLTFDAKRAGYPDKPLLINTGCWLVNLRNPAFRQVDPCGNLRFYFTIQDRIRLDIPEIHVEMEPEDWHFSRVAWECGLKVVATREVAAKHLGSWAFRNDQAWGTQ